MFILSFLLPTFFLLTQFSFKEIKKAGEITLKYLAETPLKP